MTRLSALLLAGGLSLLAGCAALSPYSELTKLDLALIGSDELNPDLNGRPSPIVVRLIELRHPVTFQNADFFSLYQRPREVLSPDMVVQEELELRPGERRELKLHVGTDSRYVGVLAAYRDLPETNWRQVIALSPKARNHSRLELGEHGIRELDEPGQE
ncbi:type VI secretion system lipoprotein TssJ [Pseudomonas sp. S5(2021)]|uniref:Type VI secretion system lipoprotein TssJ n=1 Tax=Stutzerimonas balearica TaxID=74829 RepID=A0A9X7V5N8_9GAMM|nr:MULTISPECIES: type VI secretion system lipoprotein TssJ [Pseudomonadota]MBB60087.1 type VI secretion system lipoprotein TssJ [Pseudomonas sp.]MBZ5754254.1 type VI secretion system lipoprotein TssJ [Pseudomonas sp. S5(2021)]MBS4151858.1 type VI secretion system lipoprotein TssJ [Stutzerimonas balearica]MCZ4130006.1 type VI secretion system lipoprotein TssJ [Stutzerimonas balearica]QQN49527.1 type VI secretion system lipoprotein TssJ [Stutzerimonas balearica]